ncbi:hypothetical protein ACWDR3_18770 [Streptomyces sp. NPDC001002]
MICPNCQASLLRKERTGNVCSRCGRQFALDPRTKGRGMHDTRIRRIAEKATGSGRRQVTVTQLWYLARIDNPTWAAVPKSGRPVWIGRTVGAILVVGLVALGIRMQDMRFAGLLWWACVGVAVYVFALAKGEPPRPARGAGAQVVPTLAEFRTMICTWWVHAYGSLPPGIVNDQEYRDTHEVTGPRKGDDPGPEQPQPVELLCPDRVVRVFLSVNRIPGRLNLTLAAGLSELTGPGPVVVLHDASARGFQLVADARALTPRRVVVDAGLPVRAVLDNRKAVRLHEDPPAAVLGEPQEQPDWLRKLVRRAPREAAWLTRGWFSPVAAVPPALLESAVERAVREARGALARERREAAGVGFMSWPGSSDSPVRDGS